MSLIILEGKVDVASIPNSPNGSLLLAYDLDGTLKQKNDLGVVLPISGSLPLSGILSIGNTTGPNNIILNTGSVIRGQVGQSELRLDSGNVILTVNPSLLDSFVFLGIGGNITIGNGTSSYIINNSMATISYNSNNMFHLTGTQSVLTSSGKKVLEFGNGLLSGSGAKVSAIISSDGSSIAPGVINTIVLGGTSITANQSNSVYLEKLYIKSGVVNNTTSTNRLVLNGFNESYIDSSIGIVGVFNGQDSLTRNGILIYDSSLSSNTPNIDSNIIYVGTRNSTGVINVKNSVVLGGINMVALNSNTVYLGNNVNINNKYTLPSVDGSIGQLLKTDGSGNVSWGTINGESLTLLGLTVSGVASFGALNFNYLALLGLTAGTASFNSLSVPYLNITGITANNGNFNNLSATSATINVLNLNTLNSNNGIFVSSLTASNGNFFTVSSTHSNVVTASASSITSNNIVSGVGSFTTMSSVNSSFGSSIVTNLSVTNANISTLTGSTVNFTNLSVVNPINSLSITSSNINTLVVNNLSVTNSTTINSNITGSLTASGTMSINKVASAPVNNNATKLFGLSGSQFVEVTQFVNSVTSSNNSINISATGSNFTYDFTLGFTSSTNTVQISSGGLGIYNLQIATDSKAIAGSNKFVRSNELYNEFLLKQNLPTGYVAGLTLSITPGDNTKFNIAYGGFLVTDYTDVFNVVSTIVQLPIAGLTGISPIGLTSAAATYIALDKNKNVIQSLTPFTDVDRRSLCLVGAVIHSNLTVINTTNQIVAPIIAPTNQLHDLIKAIGFMNLTGNAYSPINAATSSDLTMKKSAGEIWGLGINGGDYTDPHKLTIPSQATFSFRIRKSTTPITETADLMTLVGNLNYETIISSTNSTLTAIPNNRFGVFHGTLFQSGLTRFQYPQRIYTSLIDAVNSSHTEDYTIESNIRDNGIFRFYLIIQGATTNFSDPTRYQFVEVGKFGNVSSSAGSSLTLANILSTLGYTPENVINKQNSLNTDGTGQKYPTVDAINSFRPNNWVVVKSLSNLPTPVGGIIKAVDNTTYQITGAVNLGTNQIEPGVSNLFRGIDKSDDRLIYTGTSSMFTNGASGSNRDLSVNTLTLISTTGSVFGISGTSSNIEIKDNIIASSKSVGSIDVGGLLIFRDNFITGNEIGLSITGNNISSDFVYADNYSADNVGTFSALRLAGGSFSQILIARNIFKVGSGRTGIAYSNTFINSGNISTNSFSGAGTYLSGLSNTTAKWVFVGNQGVPNKRKELFISSSDMNGVALTTPTTAAAGASVLSDTGARFLTLRGGAGQDDGLAFTMQVPSDYFSGGSFDINFTTDTTGNNVKFFMAISKLNIGGDFGTIGETGLNIVTAGVTQYLRKEVTITPITSTFSSGDIAVVKIWRDPDDAADNANNISAYISNVQFVYNSI